MQTSRSTEFIWKGITFVVRYNPETGKAEYREKTNPGIAPWVDVRKTILKGAIDPGFVEYLRGACSTIFAYSLQDAATRI